MKSCVSPSPNSFFPFIPNNFIAIPQVVLKSGDVGVVSLEKRTHAVKLSFKLKTPILNLSGKLGRISNLP